MQYKGEEIKFRESEWEKKMKDPEFNSFVFNLLEECLVIKFDNLEESGLELDTDSVLEMEQLASDIEEGN